MAIVKIRLNEAIDGRLTSHEFSTIEQLRKWAQSGGKTSTKSSVKSGEKTAKNK